MKRELLKILACPVCKSGLELAVTEEKQQGIIRGSLSCRKCGEKYPIADAIPNLLPTAQR